MIPWSKDELRRIAEANDLHVSPLREDGVTYGTPNMGLVRRGRRRALRARLQRTEISLVSGRCAAEGGRIIAASMTMEVTFESVDGPINNRIDDAYRAKYDGSPYLSPMISARARSATVKVMPCETTAK